jgi:hypothetical protein
MNLVVILRLLAFLVLLRFLFRFVGAIVRGYREADAKAAAPRERELVRDRVCNTFLPKDRALRAVVNGHEEHFCSAACRDQALLSPARSHGGDA